MVAACAIFMGMFLVIARLPNVLAGLFIILLGIMIIAFNDNLDLLGPTTIVCGIFVAFDGIRSNLCGFLIMMIGFIESIS